MDGAGCVDDGMVRVPAADCVAALPRRTGDRLLLDFLGAAKKRLASLLRHLRQGVGPVDPLQQGVDDVAEPAQDGVVVEEFVVNMTMKEQDAAVAALEEVLLLDAD